MPLVLVICLLGKCLKWAIDSSYQVIRLPGSGHRVIRTSGSFSWYPDTMV